MFDSKSAINSYWVFKISDDLFASKADQIRKIIDINYLYRQKDVIPFNNS